MPASSPHRFASLVALIGALAWTLAAPAVAGDAKAPAAKSAAKPAAKGTTTAKGKKAAPAPAEPVVSDAGPEQVKAADLVFYGNYDCEFQQTVQIAQNAKHSAYVDVKHAKSTWLMKPVVSSTGAVRLEDVRGETLMVQISSKSMLLNTKSGQRIVDACTCDKQRELIAEAKSAKATSDAPLLKAAETSASTVTK